MGRGRSGPSAPRPVDGLIARTYLKRRIGGFARTRQNAPYIRLVQLSQTLKLESMCTQVRVCGLYVVTVTTPEPFDGELVTLLSRRGSAEHAAIA